MPKYIEKIYPIQGLNCQSCATRLQNAIAKHDGVQSAYVNFASEALQIKYDNQHAQNLDLRVAQWVAEAGFAIASSAFAAAPSDTNHHGDAPNKSTQNNDRQYGDVKTIAQNGNDAQTHHNVSAKDTSFAKNFSDATKQNTIKDFLRQNKTLSAIFGLFLANMLFMIMGTHLLPVWLQFLLASFVQVVCAQKFYKSAYYSLKGRLANMDVLVSLGTVCIWLYSSYVFLQSIGIAHTHMLDVYFEAQVMVLFFVSFGKFVEKRTKQSSFNATKMLARLIPKFVKVQKNGTFCTLSIDKVVVGDILLARQHERIALDGMVVDGAAFCDESHLTGESMSVQKRIGDVVLAGAWVQDGNVQYRATTCGQNHTLQQMIDTLEKAQGSKADIARIADRVSHVFVPFVAATALLTFLINFYTADLQTAVLRAVAVLVIACPCALGLATPAAIMAGMQAAARHGVWFLSAKSLERSGDVDVIAFDKTGTLTKAAPTIVAQSLVDGKINIDWLLGVVSSVEQYANHPLAHAFLQISKQKQLPSFSAQNVQVFQKGITADIDGVGSVAVGAPEFVGYQHNISSDSPWNIASLVAVAINHAPVAIFAITDSEKDNAKKLIDKLKSSGSDVIILSGDKPQAVAYIAKKLGITRFFGDCLPNDKQQKIVQLQQSGQKVLMVGDGINDALAMTQADASFAVQTATDVAQSSADAYLLGECLSGVYYAKTLAQKTLSNIKQNLFFAFIYNIFGMFAAAFGYLTPTVAAALMSASSICVVLNATRLVRIKLFDDWQD